MSQNKLQSLSINIAGEVYPLKLNEAEVQIARKVEKELNHQINDFQLKYQDVDRSESIVMVLISNAFEKHLKESNKDQKIAQKIDILEQLIESKLS